MGLSGWTRSVRCVADVVGVAKFFGLLPVLNFAAIAVSCNTANAKTYSTEDFIRYLGRVVDTERKTDPHLACTARCGVPGRIAPRLTYRVHMYITPRDGVNLLRTYVPPLECRLHVQSRWFDKAYLSNILLPPH